MVATINPSGQTITQYTVQTGGANNLLNSVGPGSAGQVLQSAGSSNPVYSTATYPATAGTSGTILQSNGTNIVNTTATYPGTATSAGKILRADGTNWAASTATYPNTATGTGTVLRADGTNWTPSTATYPDTAGTSGNVLTSDGTNWTSAAATSGQLILTGLITLTSAQIKALHGTPIQVIATPGAGKVIAISTPVWSKFTYGGTNVFVAGAAQVIRLYYGTATNICTVCQNTVLTSSTSQYMVNIGPSPVAANLSNMENLALNLYNDNATEISGNAAANNTLTLSFFYYIITI